MIKSLGRVGFWCKQFRGIFVVWLSTAALAINQQLNHFHLLIISKHSREKSQLLSKCWKVSTKTKFRCKCVCANKHEYLSVTACVFWLAHFYCLSPNMCLTFACKDDWASRCDEYSLSDMPCFKAYLSAVITFPTYWTVSDISISTICNRAYSLWQNLRWMMF